MGWRPGEALTPPPLRSDIYGKGVVVSSGCILSCRGTSADVLIWGHEGPFQVCIVLFIVPCLWEGGVYCWYCWLLGVETGGARSAGLPSPRVAAARSYGGSLQKWH